MKFILTFFSFYFSLYLFLNIIFDNISFHSYKYYLEEDIEKIHGSSGILTTRVWRLTLSVSDFYKFIKFPEPFIIVRHFYISPRTGEGQRPHVFWYMYGEPLVYKKQNKL